MTTTDRGGIPLSVWDRRYCCPWCPHEAPIPTLLTEHKTRCANRPIEEDSRGSE